MKYHAITDRSRTSGFTLIEILAVLLIMSILVAFIVRGVGGGQTIMEIESTRSFIQLLGGSIEQYEQEHGAYPPSKFPADMDPKPSKVNMGAEMLLISLYGRDASWHAADLPEERLGNTDQDTTKKTLTTFANAAAFETVDAWGNPIAYFNRKDYKIEVTYLTFDEAGNPIEALLKGLVSPKTGNPYQSKKFQLISAGPDGVFLTRDDIANFEIDEP